ncbi:MAG: hypothetical protein BHV99_05530 [Clostridium sp. 26_21]|nr:MAG: hypothetical protein BHV99_05530 [Clostridium sp. 26_21]
MENLGVIRLYDEANQENTQKFMDSAESTLKVQVDKKIITKDTEWIDLMEEVIPHLDIIFRKPNRFIENEEEIVKIEQTRKVSVETIKHLSKNTNFIQKIDEKTGDVIPSRLLNVRKEESFNTYENRLIYTLMQNIKFFIHKRKELIEQSFDKNNDEQGKNNKQLEYNAKSKLNEEDVDINVSISSKLNSQENEKNDGNGIVNRIEEIEKKIKDVESSEVYKILDKLHVILVKDPVRKTNVVLKNVHFQYAMKLWEYLKVNMDEQANSSEENRDFLDNGTLKKMMDEAFLLQYLIMKTLDEDEKEKQDTKQEIKALVVEQMLDKIMDCDEDITEEQLQQLVAEKYEVIKYKKMAVLQDIQKIFKKHIEKYEKIVE